MRMTSKGQVTVPKHLRKKLGVEPGDEIGFREEGQVVIIHGEKGKPVENRGLALVRHLQEKARHAKRIAMTTEELMELTRGPFNDLDAH